MDNKTLAGKRVAILVADGFEQVELTEPRRALEEAGAHVALVSSSLDQVQGFNHADKADLFPVEVHLDDANEGEFDALLLPGGVANPDALRLRENAVAFVRAFADAGKPIAAICHAPWLLIEAGIVRGRKLTSWPSLKTDLINAGATWVDEEVVTDNGLVTSRRPSDIPAFNRKMIEEFAEGIHAPARAQAAGASR